MADTHDSKSCLERGEGSSPSSGTMEKKLTVVYDDGCPVCTVGKNTANALDREDAVDFVGMNTERGKTFIAQHNLDMNASAYALHEDGRITEKSQMVRDVLEHNGILGYLSSLPFRVPYFNDTLYDFLAWTRWHATKSKK